VQFLHLDPDPDPATQINADPDPQPWLNPVLRINKWDVPNLKLVGARLGKENLDPDSDADAEPDQIRRKNSSFDNENHQIIQ
jgi:hypothetical protein